MKIRQPLRRSGPALQTREGHREPLFKGAVLSGTLDLRKQKREVSMATYIALCSYTAEGIKAIKEAPKRLDKAKALARKLGGEMKALYLTMGSCDVIAVY